MNTTLIQNLLRDPSVKAVEVMYQESERVSYVETFEDVPRMLRYLNSKNIQSVEPIFHDYPEIEQGDRVWTPDGPGYVKEIGWLTDRYFVLIKTGEREPYFRHQIALLEKKAETDQ